MLVRTRAVPAVGAGQPDQRGYNPCGLGGPERPQVQAGGNVIGRNGFGAGRGVLVAALASAAFIASAGAIVVAPAAAASADVTIVDFAFQPATLTVFVGDPVTWTNKGAETHTVTLDDGSLDSGPIAPGEAFGHVFEAPGTFTYHCAIHRAMVATIVVKAAPVTPTPSGSPQPTPPPGTLPPNFSPFPAQPTPEPTAPTPTPAPSTEPTPAPGTGGGSGDLLLTAVVVVIVAGGILSVVVLVRRARAS